MNPTIKELLSGENGILSSKRTMGVLSLIVCLGCIVYLVIIEGGTNVVENLLQTAMMMAAGLLGVSTVTGIWRGKKHRKNGPDAEIQETIDPCEGCPHNKKGTD